MIFTAGTITNSIKLATLENKWQQKKDSGNVLSKEEVNKRVNWTQEEWLKHDFEEQAARVRETSKKTKIDNKIMSGGTLTPEEEKYLEQKDPAALQKYRQTKREKKEYEEKLRNCKSKDEVERLKTETLGGYLSSFKKIENNPYIPISEKLAKAQEMLAKTRNILDAEMKFKQSAEYLSLPTEAEERTENRSENREIEEDESLEDMEKTNNENIGEELTEEVMIENTYNRIKLNADLEFETKNIKQIDEKRAGQKVDFSV